MWRQNVMNAVGAHVTVDGAIGPATMQALQGLDQKDIYRCTGVGR